MNWRHLGEPDVSSIIEDGVQDCLVGGHQSFSRETPARPSLGFHDVQSPWGPLNTIASIGVKGEVGVQQDSQDFRGSVQWGHCVANSHLRVVFTNSHLRGVFANSHLRVVFTNSHLRMVSAHPTKEEQSWSALASASTMLVAEASNVKLSV